MRWWEQTPWQPPECVDCGDPTGCEHPRLGPMCPWCQDARAVGLRCPACGAEQGFEAEEDACACGVPLERVWQADEGDVCGCGACAAGVA